MEFDKTGGPAHGLVTKTVHTSLPGFFLGGGESRVFEGSEGGGGSRRWCRSVWEFFITI